MDQERLYLEASAEHGAALARLASGYERDPDLRRDLVQDIHVQLWRSLATYDRRCSLRTWTYRVAHNVAASHVDKNRRRGAGLVGIEEALAVPDPVDPSGKPASAGPKRNCSS